MKIVSCLLFLSLTVIMFACSESCDGENPTVQLLNGGTDKADIQIKTSGGNTENVNNIEPGNYSEKRSFEPGEIEFTIAIQGVNDPIVYYMIIDYCTENIVKINEDNSVTSISIRLDYF